MTNKIVVAAGLIVGAVGLFMAAREVLTVEVQQTTTYRPTSTSKRKEIEPYRSGYDGSSDSVLNSCFSMVL